MGAAQAVGSNQLLSYDEAARMLRIKPASVKQLVVRGHLHSIPAPEDRRRRRLLRTEVAAYAQSHAGKWTYPENATKPTWGVHGSVAPQSLSPNLAAAGVVSVGAAIPLIAAFKGESDTAIRLLIVGALIALALLLFLEWQRQGKLDDAQKRHLEQFAKQAEATPEKFVAELEQLIHQKSAQVLP